MPFADLGRISLFYRVEGAGDPPVLLLHELGGSGDSWNGVIPLLSGTRRVIAPDLRNAGRSEKPPGAHTLEDHADDLAALFAALGVEQADVIGSALGSIVALVLALRHPRLVRRMVLCAAAPEISETARAYLAERAERVRREGMRPVADASLANAFPDPHGPARDAYRPAFLANAPEPYAELSLALSRMALSEADFARITARTVVLQGAQDFIWPPATGERVASLLPGGQFRVLETGAHFPHLQIPNTLAPTALAFLESGAQ